MDGNPPSKQPSTLSIHPWTMPTRKVCNPYYPCYPPMDSRGGLLRDPIHLQGNPLVPDYDAANAFSLTEHLGPISHCSQPKASAKPSFNRVQGR